jgi:hypothetical protein
MDIACGQFHDKFLVLMAVVGVHICEKSSIQLESCHSALYNDCACSCIQFSEH